MSRRAAAVGLAGPTPSVTSASIAVQVPEEEPVPRRHEGLWWGGALAIVVALLIGWRIRQRRRAARARRERGDIT